MIHIETPNYDGSPYTALGTRVITDNGEQLKGIRSIQIDLAPQRIVTARIELCDVAVSIDAMPKYLVRHPVTGELREVTSIVFADGAVWAAEW